MKTTSRNLLMAAVSVSMLLAPVVSLAAANSMASSTGAGVNFCTQFATRSAALQQRLTSITSKLDQARSQRDQALLQRQQQEDANLQKIRQQEDQNRTNQINALMAKATTTSEKQAVTAFQNTLTTALATRRAAVDAAIAAFRAGVKNAITTREQAVDTAYTAYQNAVSAAIAQANSSCSSGTAPRTARQNFVTAMSAANQNFRTARQNAEKVGPQVQQLLPTRKQAVQNAFNAFKTTMEQARTALDAAFKSSSSASSTPTTN